MKQTYETGIRGEEEAENYLVNKFGMKCLERRYKTKAGEIDLIMLDHDTVVFAEVKTRTTGERGNGMAAVNIAKQKRILKASVLYLLRMGWTNRLVRFDLIEVFNGDIFYVPDAFRPYGNYFH